MSGYLEELKADIAARLRPMCDNVSEEEFAALVQRMAELKYRYEMRVRHDIYPDDPLVLDEIDPRPPDHDSSPREHGSAGPET